MGDRDSTRVANAATEVILQSNMVRLEYLEIVDPETLQPVDAISGPVRAAGATWVGSTRLIDNLLIEP